MNHIVVLAHGYNKGPTDMATLEKNLTELGFQVIVLDLPLTFSEIKKASAVFTTNLNQIISDLEEDEIIHLVGHSTGGLVIRYFLTTAENIDQIGRCVLIATPNQGSQLATIADKTVPLFTKIFKTLRSLKPQNLEQLNLEMRAEVELGAIAGDKSNLLLGNLLKQANDGRISVESVNYSGLKAFIVVSYGHKEIHYQSETAKLVANFIKHGSFNRKNKL
jgi:pimeloyl-ACP methyl ester carboxylesterase